MSETKTYVEKLRRLNPIYATLQTAIGMSLVTIGAWHLGGFYAGILAFGAWCAIDNWIDELILARVESHAQES